MSKYQSLNDYCNRVKDDRDFFWFEELVMEWCGEDFQAHLLSHAPCDNSTHTVSEDESSTTNLC